MTCALIIFSVLDNFCQIAPLHSNAVWMTRVLHLICKAHTHLLLFRSKFSILAMYVQMLDIYWKYWGNVIFLWYFWYFQKYHDIFQPWLIRVQFYVTWNRKCGPWKDLEFGFQNTVASMMCSGIGRWCTECILPLLLIVAFVCACMFYFFQWPGYCQPVSSVF